MQVSELYHLPLGPAFFSFFVWILFIAVLPNHFVILNCTYVFLGVRFSAAILLLHISLFGSYFKIFAQLPWQLTHWCTHQKETL
jgi:uncharacterized membrane protein